MWIIVFLIPHEKTVAQDNINFTQYMNNKMYFNPAVAGINQYMEFNMVYRNQWQDITGSPQSSLLSLSAPLNYSKVGLGITVYNDKIGIRTNNAIFVNYAYHLKVGDHATLSMGLMAGVSNKRLRWSELTTYDPFNISPDDPSIPSQDMSVWVPNFGVGIYLYTPQFYLGLSAPRFVYSPLPTSGSLSDNFSVNGKDIVFYLNGGLTLPINENMELNPSFLIQSSLASSLDATLSANIVLQTGLFWGAGYRLEDAWTAVVGYQFSPKLKFSYSYDKTISKLSSNRATHEIILNYNLSLRKNQITSPRYF